MNQGFELLGGPVLVLCLAAFAPHWLLLGALALIAISGVQLVKESIHHTRR